MLRKFKDSFGAAGLILAIAAMATALVGGAYAASSDGGGGKATASAKAKKGPRGPKGATGPKGAAGAAGPQGPAGPAGAPGARGEEGEEGLEGKEGKAGKNGTNGTNGLDGKSVVVTPIASGGAQCEGRKGALVEKEGTPPGAEVCEGSPWAVGGILPPGATEVGSWSFFAPAAKIKVDVEGTTEELTIGNELVGASISFPIRLPASLQEAEVHYGFQESGGAFAPDGACPGRFLNPEAALGQLCVYESQASVVGATFVGINKNSVAGAGAAPSGAFLQFEVGAAPGRGGGSFAVTGCSKEAGAQFPCPV
jgi:hypothetical protein